LIQKLIFDTNLISMDPLEKDRLRKQMARTMVVFLESASQATCVSGHLCEEVSLCQLCGRQHMEEMLILKNRAGKKISADSSCVLDMVRFKVVDVVDLPKWLGKFKELRVEAEKRKAELLKQREEERKKLEKKVIVRKRPPTVVI